MDTEEKAVIDEFLGKDEYVKAMIEPEFYLVETSVLMLADGGQNQNEEIAAAAF